MSPDRLRMIPEAVAFVKHFAVGGKPIAAICHGPWTLIEADAVRGRTMTSWPSLKPTSAMPVHIGSMPKRSATKTLLPGASRMIFQRSAGR